MNTSPEHSACILDLLKMSHFGEYDLLSMLNDFKVYFIVEFKYKNFSFVTST